jgi:hypothetical protein
MGDNFYLKHLNGVSPLFKHFVKVLEAKRGVKVMVMEPFYNQKRGGVTIG